MVDLIKLSTEELLNKFGSGHHKPGSGSAAALQGMLAAQLVRTVLEISQQKPNYNRLWPEFNRMRIEIENRIFPELLQYFQLDSEQFDLVINLRQKRDDEINSRKKRQLIEAIHDAMLPATQIPIKIANLCAELAEFALFICEHGFQSARGDSGVALNNSIATISGCLSIVNLNLLSLGDNEQIEELRIQAEKLKHNYLELSKSALDQLATLEEQARQQRQYLRDLQAISSGQWQGAKISNFEIENIARQVQNTLWKYHERILKRPVPDDVIDILKPQTVITKMLRYNYHETATLGQHFVDGELFEIAGVIDNSKKVVSISKHFSQETQNFTAAHELGHALLHRQVILHRDRPLDGSNAGRTRELIELQADKFATFFLMPGKSVERLFKQLFFTDKFIINEDNVFGLTGRSVGSFTAKCKQLRDLSRILANAESFSGEHFRSMSKIFNVSVETMAIRLEELQLVEFN